MSLVAALGRSSTALERFKSQAEAAGKAAKGVGDKAKNGDGDLKKFKGSAKDSAKELKGLQTAADQAEKSVGKAGKTGQGSGGLLGKFKSGADGAGKGMSGLNKSMKGNLIGVLLGLLAPLIAMVVDMAMQSKTMQKIMKVAFDAIQTAISTTMKVVGPIMKKAGDLIKGIFKGIMTAISPVIDWIRTKIPAAFQKVRDKLSSAWGGLQAIAKEKFDALIGPVKGPLNTIIDVINSAIGKLNGIKVTIPGWVPFVGGKTFGVSLPTIPRLAEGGLVMPRSGGVPAILAEAGEAEAVLPLSKLDRLLTRTAVQARLAGAGAAGVGTGFHIENYYAASDSSAQQTADALTFLSKARG
ncbi:phage tail protein [Peterkaempfera bronchialis]|uniref:phage tail protein n=1 Tax=Peterkaempfera bronchialis TaxID=2126346 RepID=UPI003C306994